MLIPPVTDVHGRPNGLLALLLGLSAALFVLAAYLAFSGTPCDVTFRSEITVKSLERVPLQSSDAPRLDSRQMSEDEADDLAREFRSGQDDPAGMRIGESTCIDSTSIGKGLWAAGSGMVLVWVYRRVRHGRPLDLRTNVLIALLLAGVWLLTWPPQVSAFASSCGGPVLDPGAACPETGARTTQALFLMLFVVPLAMGVTRRDTLADLAAPAAADAEEPAEGPRDRPAAGSDAVEDDANDANGKDSVNEGKDKGPESKDTDGGADPHGG